MTNGGPYRKPQADIYTLMLLIALVAVILATVFAYLETKDYGSPPYQGGPSVSIRSHGPSDEAILLSAVDDPMPHAWKTRMG